MDKSCQDESALSSNRSTAGRSRTCRTTAGTFAFAGLLLLAASPDLSAAAAPGVPGGLQAVVEGIEPHRAAYDLSLDRSLSSPEIASAVGRLEFEWADVCSGWTVQQRSRVLLDRAEGPRVDFGWTLNAWEAKSGQRYRFIIRRFFDGLETEETRGEAELGEGDDPGRARFEDPDGFEVALPAGTVFPTAHSLEILAHATEETLPFWRLVFDGSGDDGGLSGVSVLPVAAYAPGERELPLPEGSSGAELLADEAGWRVQLAFFSPGEVDALPLHEQTLTLYGNGVADNLLFDYGDFSLRARLVELEALPDPGC